MRARSWPASSTQARSEARIEGPLLWLDPPEEQLRLPFPGPLAGLRPVLFERDGWREELIAAADIMARAVTRGVRPNEIALLARRPHALELLSAILLADAAELLPRSTDPSSSADGLRRCDRSALEPDIETDSAQETGDTSPTGDLRP